MNTQRKLPNGTTVLVLGICSIITCWCYGVVGIIAAVLALVFYHKDIKLYQENPELYKDYSSLSIGRVLSIIGLCLSTLYLIFVIYMLAVVGEDGMKDFMHNLEVKAQQQQESQE